MPIPRLRGALLAGNLLELRRDRIGLLERVAAECGEIGSIRLGHQPVVVISSPELARVVLIDRAEDFEKGPVVRRFARPVLGDGLIAASNALQRKRRRLVAPAFRPRAIAHHAAAMVEDAERAAQGWADGAELDLAGEMLRLTLRIVGRTLFSVDLLGEARDLNDALGVALHHVSGRIQRPFALPLSIPTPHNRRVRAAIARLDATIFRMIAERRRSQPGLEETGAGDLLSTLVAARDEEDGSRLDDLAVRDEVMNLFVAGHETTAHGLAWAWASIARDPAVEAALAEELARVLGGRAPEHADLERLPFTLQILKEALRLYPPVHTLGRQAARAVELGPYRLAEGAIVIVSPYLIHRRADLFPSPERFDPSRFTPEAEARLPRLGYLPFGAGPRVCVGGHFALVEMQLVVATLAQRVRFSLRPDARIEPEMLVTLRPRHGVPVTVTRLPEETSAAILR